MGRKSKYSKQLKLEIVKRYLGGESATKLANEYGLNSKRSNVRVLEWSKKYEAYGEHAFNDKPINKRYSKDLKLKAINEYLNGEGSFESISIKYGISHHSILRAWFLKYNSHIEIKDYDPKPEVYMAKSRKTTKKERIEIVSYCIKNNNDYKGTATEFGLNYSQVYNWVKKFKEQGPDGLSDGRGRKKQEHELSELEKLKRENEKLAVKNKYLKMENDALKKLEEIERRTVKERYKK